MFVFACLDSERRDERFKLREGNERSRCKFWVPGYQSGFGSSLSACADLIILRFHFYFLCKPRTGPGIECVVHVHVHWLSFLRLESPRGRRTSGFQEHVASARNPKGAKRSFSFTPERAGTPTRAQVAALDGCSGQSSCRCYLVTAYV